MSEELAQGAGGGLNAAKTEALDLLDTFRLARLENRLPTPQVTAVVTDESGNSVVKGTGFSPVTRVHVNGRSVRAEYLDPHSIRLHHFVAKPGDVVSACTDLPHVVPTEDESPVRLLDIAATGTSPLRTDCNFGLVVTFEASERSPARILRLTIVAPGAKAVIHDYRVSTNESRAGQKLLDGFSVPVGGTFVVDAALFDESGSADYLERGFPVVPSNPLQLYVYPQHDSPGGAGSAEYRSSNNRYYCEGRWVVSNGNSYSVTVGPEVRCRVSDAGLGELADFTFNISSVTVPANSTRTLWVYTYFPSGNDVYELFKDFGDAKFEFWLDTTAGDISDWNVWVGAAQVGLTANFVGTFSWAEKLAVRDAIETQASGIYSDVDCIFSPSTPILEIPSSNSDFGRYRDIRVAPTKGGACTDSDEADDMRDDWSAPSTYNHRIDIFIVETFSGDACASTLGGFSPVDGPTSKGGDNSGVVIDLDDKNILSSTTSTMRFGIVIAHEVGHYLGLRHSTAANNFMRATLSTANTSIQYSQWKTMRDHGFVRRLNP